MCARCDDERHVTRHLHGECRTERGPHRLGIIFLIASMAGAGASRMWFRIFGVVYALVAILGFMTRNGMLLGMISNNVADTWLHVILAVAMLFLGFVAKDTATA
ncbi:MAG TPA: DUF4383 domain-containing protein [Chthoniobacterales bacterium]|nr:DUF4383 domain-containing protein [Chthoniobacterales bacterium]